jgi:hypothetical protein
MNDGPFGGITFIKHDSEKPVPKPDDTPMVLVIRAMFPLVRGEPDAMGAVGPGSAIMSVRTHIIYVLAHTRKC